jgi:hypothetical protein
MYLQLVRLEHVKLPRIITVLLRPLSLLLTPTQQVLLPLFLAL